MAKNRPKTFNLASRTPEGVGWGVVGGERVVTNFVSISNQLRYFIFINLFMYVILIFSFGVIAFTNCNCISVYLYLYFCCLFERKKIKTIKKKRKKNTASILD